MAVVYFCNRDRVFRPADDSAAAVVPEPLREDQLCPPTSSVTALP